MPKIAIKMEGNEALEMLELLARIEGVLLRCEELLEKNPDDEQHGPGERAGVSPACDQG